MPDATVNDSPQTNYRAKVYKELEKIIEYGLDNFHEDRAYNYYNGFFKVFKHLQNMPYSGQMYKDDSTIRKYTYE